jgi:steroid delta-isomerase-like uncharacterized protein
MTAKEITDRVWAAVESGDLDALEGLAQPDVRFYGIGMELNGVDELRGMLEAYLEGFPDLNHEVRDYVESDGTIALELHVRGTHTGTMRGPQGEIPATGKPVLWESCDYIKVRDGKVASWHVYNDQLAFLVQLGLAPDPAAQPV